MIKLHSCTKKGLKKQLDCSSGRYSRTESCLCISDHQPPTQTHKTTKIFQSMTKHIKISLAPGAYLISQKDFWALGRALLSLGPSELLEWFPLVTIMFDPACNHKKENVQEWKTLRTAGTKTLFFVDLVGTEHYDGETVLPHVKQFFILIFKI